MDPINFSNPLNEPNEFEECTVLIPAWSGRDSGVSSGTSSGISSNLSNNQTNDSIKSQDTNEKLFSQVERQLESIVMTSHKELNDAKQKLEELRLLRLEEKSSLKKEIEYLNEKVDGEEKNTYELEEQLTRQKKLTEQVENKANALLKEQTVANQINMMQEQEIVRLEMKLKGGEMERFNLSKQLDLHRRTIVERDKFRIQQNNEIFNLTEKLNSFEESVSYYKTETDSSYRKLIGYESELETLRDEVTTLSAEIEGYQNEGAKSRLLLKQFEISNSSLKDDVMALNLQLTEQDVTINALRARCEEQDDESRRREVNLQKELDQSLFNETKLEEKTNVVKKQLEELQLANFQKNIENKRKIEETHQLEEELLCVNNEKSNVQFTLTELQDTLSRHIRNDTLKMKSHILSTNINEISSQQHQLTSNDVNDYFLKVTSKLRSLQADVNDISKEKENRENVIQKLNNTILGLKHDLDEVNGNLVYSSKLKESMDEQYNRLNSTLKIQEKDIERRQEESEYFKCLYEQSQERIKTLEEEKHLTRLDISHNDQIYEEEKLKLKNNVDELKNKNRILLNEKQVSESHLKNEMKTHENKMNATLQKEEELAESFNISLENKNNEVKTLKKQLNKLISDNKNLAQRLIHLESYSDRLSKMIETNEGEKDKLKEKLQKLNTSYKTGMNDKTKEIESLNRSLHEKVEKQDKVNSKLKKTKEVYKDMEKINMELRKKNEELKEKLKVTQESLVLSERRVLLLNEEIDNFTKRFEDQTENVEELFLKLHEQEQEKTSLKDRLLNSEKRMQLKESLIAELSKKSSSATSNYNSLKQTLSKVEFDEKERGEKLKTLENEKSQFERSFREQDNENQFLKDQISNFKRLLIKAEDEKDYSLNELVSVQRRLDSERIKNEKILDEARESMQKKGLINDMQTKLTVISDELDSEKRRRERLETLFTKRDQQVTKLKSTFDESLNTLTTDTKSIKNILGKSLQKIDKQIRKSEGLITDSEYTESDLESDFSLSKQSSHKYFHLPKTKSRLMNTSLDRLYERTTPPMFSSNYGNNAKQFSSTVKIASNRPGTVQELPVRDALTN